MKYDCATIRRGIVDEMEWGELPDRLWRRAIEMYLLSPEGMKGRIPKLSVLSWYLRRPEGEILSDLEELEKLAIVWRNNDGGWELLDRTMLGSVWQELGS